MRATPGQAGSPGQRSHGWPSRPYTFQACWKYPKLAIRLHIVAQA